MSLTVKVYFEDEVRRLSVESTHGVTKFSALQRALEDVVHSIKQTSYSFTYEDDERDIITVSSDQELTEAIGVMKAIGTGVPKFTYKKAATVSLPKHTPHASSTVVHFGVRCDGCRMFPIVGERFKSSIRPNFDLCAKCHAQSGAQQGSLNHMGLIEPAGAPAASQPTSTKLPSSSTPPVHKHVTCDECFASPIKGVRYSCTKRPNFDLCEKCEAKKAQPFPMRKFYRPATFSEFFQRTAACTNVSAVQGVSCAKCACVLERGKCAYQCSQRPHCFLCVDCEAREMPPHPTVKLYTLPSAVGTAPVAAHRSNPVHASAPVTSAVLRSAPPPPTASATVPSSGTNGTSCWNYSNHLNSWDLPVPPAAVSPFIAGMDTLAATVDVGRRAWFAPSVPNRPCIRTQCGGTTVTAPPVKPSLKFVRDVTLSDGTAVQPGAVLEKQWLVCNDGHADWPAGVVLCTAGGDILTTVLDELFSTTGNDFMVAAIDPPLKAGEQRVISVAVSVPSVPGRYVSYFRMKTAQGQRFGQRLWADLVVTDNGSGVPSVPDTVATSNTNDVVADSLNVQLTTTASTGSDSAVATVISPAATADVAQQLQPQPQDWSRELTLLAEMGFSDQAAIVPLLQVHVKAQVGADAAGTEGVMRCQSSGALDAEGMRKVVACLLGLQLA